jgi:predicted nucleic acid-binding protein
LETSIFSRLADPAGSPKRRTTEAFVRSARLTHTLVFGAVVIDEILETRGRLHREAILDRTWASGAELLPLYPETRKMAKDLLAAGRWSGRRIADMVHLAYTLLADADALVTWDTDDLARPRPRTIVHAYARRMGMPAPLIGTPEEVATWLDIRIR